VRRLPLVLLLLAACGSPAKVTLSAEEERILRPLPVPPDDDVRRLVARGDELFVSAIPEKDPKTSLGLYGKARSSYLEAQTHYSGLVPPPLLDRVKECVNRIAALQRQQHASPQ